MADIIDNEEQDKDTVDLEVLEEQFNICYHLATEKAVSLKKAFINKIDGNKLLNVAVSLSDNSIEIYQITATTLSRVCHLSGHDKPVSDVVFSPVDDHLLYSSGHDGQVKLWDIRKGGFCVQEFKETQEDVLKPYDCMDVSCDGRVLCGGSQLVIDDAFLVFWDHRKPEPLGGYWNSHTDDITQVKFHNTNKHTLASGSIDGLINVFNILEESEDDALLYSLNVENSVEKMTWIDDSQLSCITQSNDLQLWNTETGDLIRSFARDKVAKSIKRSKGDDCYLVDVFTTTDNSQVLLAGSYGERGDILRSVTINEKKLQPRTNYKENKQIVRGCWYHKQRDILVTVGESGIISVWEQKRKQHDIPSNLSLKNPKLNTARHKPY